MSSTTPSNHCQKVKFRPGKLSYENQTCSIQYFYMHTSRKVTGCFWSLCVRVHVLLRLLRMRSLSATLNIKHFSSLSTTPIVLTQHFIIHTVPHIDTLMTDNLSAGKAHLSHPELSVSDNDTQTWIGGNGNWAVKPLIEGWPCSPLSHSHPKNHELQY